MAAMGIAFKTLSFAGILSHEPYWIRAVLYLGMGWLALALAPDIVRAVGLRGLGWAIYGGLAYTLGVAVEIQGEPVLWPGVIGPHELFHVLVMVGTFCHFIFIWRYVLPCAQTATGCVSELFAEVEIAP
jgi:hemolysin III